MPSTDIQTTPAPTFNSFAQFHAFYLGEHRNRTCRTLHFIGTSIGALLLLTAVLTAQPWLIAVGLVQGYVWAWVGHFGFEKNKPASFKQPFYFFMGDWVMWWQMLTGRIGWQD